MNLNFGLNFADLYNREGLVKIDAEFIQHLKQADLAIYNKLLEARSCAIMAGNPASPSASPSASQAGSQVASSQAASIFASPKEESNFLIELAPIVEEFTAKLFNITTELAQLQAAHNRLSPLYKAKRLFVQRRAAKLVKPADAEAITKTEAASFLHNLNIKDDANIRITELAFAKAVMSHIDERGRDKEGSSDIIKEYAAYASWALYNKEGQEKHKHGILFKEVKKLDFDKLVPIETEIIEGITVKRLHPSHQLRERDGFALTDTSILDDTALEIALDDANYCIYCHNQGRDSCSKGLKAKLAKPAKVASPEGIESTATIEAEIPAKSLYKQDPFGGTLAGCPLEEKISEMNILKSTACPIGALAVIVVDNPMCAGTGHRICNDCMKSCVYQKQEPVNIPRTETTTLQNVLDLPYGFEIYSLFTRWNPLNIARSLPKTSSGYKILTVGMGPAGYTVSHHLLNDGHLVVGIDGLKIEPLPQALLTEPVKNTRDLFENLNDRPSYGFGGVAEYGITNRWNKNYLMLIRLLLERRQHFAMFGGTRFGGTITYQSAREMGFDHIALCMGAGKPTIIDIPNALVKGVRTASDFLMGLQLSGAGRKDSIANLELRLPVLVIGGGLTAIDTATESLAYYPIQVEKFLHRYESLTSTQKQELQASWSDSEKIASQEYITHAKAIRAEKTKATQEGRKPNIIKLLKSWGGAKLVYRKNMEASPAYRLNHEEIEKAMEEGIEFLEQATPHKIEIDEFGNASALVVKLPKQTKEDREAKKANPEDGDHLKTLPARTIFMAAGTSPNTVLAREDGTFTIEGKFFKTIDKNGDKIIPEPSISKPHQPNILVHKGDDDKYVSFFGDLHPSYLGNVVKAMASAKQGYPIISEVLEQAAPVSKIKPAEFITNLKENLTAIVHQVNRLTPTIIEVVMKAPLASKEFQPGQFYRMQNFEADAPKGSAGTKLAMEGLAMTGAWVDKEAGLISIIALEMGGSSNLCENLNIGEQIVLMGPTGTPTEIPAGKDVMLVGGGLGNAVLFSIGKALKAAGSRVLYFAGYKKMADRYKMEEIEKASDIIIWCCDEGSFTPERQQDRSFHGNIVQAMVAYGEGKLGEPVIKMQDVEHIITIGSDRMMWAVKEARHKQLKPYLKTEHLAIGSINSPMQCMMKEICAQCLQRHIDPITGEESYVYSCFNQDQPLDNVDFKHLNERLQQNSLQEKLTKQWLKKETRQAAI